jgi:hypothetical protein
MELWGSTLRVVCIKDMFKWQNPLARTSKRIFELGELHLQVQSAGQLVIVVMIVDVTVEFP